MPQVRRAPRATRSWVPGDRGLRLEGTDELLLLDPATGEVVERLDDLPRNPHDAAHHPDGTVAVTDEFGGGMYFVRPGGEVVRLDSSRQPGGVAAAGELAVMVDVVGEGVRVYDVREPAEVASADLGEGLTHLVTLGDDRLSGVGQVVVVRVRRIPSARHSRASAGRRHGQSGSEGTRPGARGITLNGC